MSQIANSNRASNGNMNNGDTSVSVSNSSKHFALFCDISEKDFESAKTGGYKLFLVVYAIRNIKVVPLDRHSSLSTIFAGGGN